MRTGPSSHYIAHDSFAFRRRTLVEFRLRPALDAPREPLRELRPDRGIFLVIENRAAAFAEANRAIVGELFAGTSVRERSVSRPLLPQRGGDKVAS